jgi:hypothetical protein
MTLRRRRCEPDTPQLLSGLKSKKKLDTTHRDTRTALYWARWANRKKEEPTSINMLPNQEIHVVGSRITRVIVLLKRNTILIHKRNSPSAIFAAIFRSISSTMMLLMNKISQKISVKEKSQESEWHQI